MSELRLQTLEFPAARFGPANPLAALRSYHTVSIADASDTPADDASYADRGNEASILPYALQDNYDREKMKRSFKVAVLENEILRATFMLELGGRLWSLFHKPSGRELLFANPVVQPANLAVRDAWIAGGVEWNVSIIGHCPFTCSPLFAARVTSADGTPILRLYEYERVRGVLFQIDCCLPDGSNFLLVRPQISNPTGQTIPMYWWSNIAVDETEGIRVIAPAQQAYYHAYDRSLKSQDLPFRDGEDVTYPTRRAAAADLYFRFPRGQRPWIAALDAGGRGLIHTSTQRLIGRKMFNWGTSPGGQRWQEHLSAPGRRYLEIQGGLATKQTEYVPMPAGAKWQWLEAYGEAQIDPKVVHSDWQSATAHVETILEGALPRVSLDDRFEHLSADADRPPDEILQLGSGWGALEDRRRAKAGLSPLASAGIPFPAETIGPEQEPWLRLLDEGSFPYQSPRESPGAYMTDASWRSLLAESMAAGRGVHWLSLLHLGTMRYRSRDMHGAKEAWQRSASLEPSAWTYRSLAVLAADETDLASAADLWVAAARMKPDLVPLLVEACEAMLAAGHFQELRRLVDSLSPEVQRDGRVRLLGAIAGLRSGDLSAPQRFFSEPFDISNIREGELSVSDLWFDWRAALLAKKEGVGIDDALRKRVRGEFPLPKEFDFRMTPD